MGFFKKKNGKKGRPSSTYSQEPLTPMSASSAPMKSQYSSFSQVSILEAKDKKYKRTIRILRFVSRLGSLVLSALMVCIMGYSLSRYYLTKTTPLPSDPTQTAWPIPTVLWPTYMLLSIALATFVMNALTLASYCFGVGAANKTSSVGSVVIYVLTALHALVWAVSTGAYKMAEMKGNDLWGYTCGSASDKIQAEVRSFLDFGKLCTAQGGAWYASIIQTALYILTSIVTVLVACRASNKRKLGKARGTVSLEMQGQSPSGLAPYNNPYMASGYGNGGGGGYAAGGGGAGYFDARGGGVYEQEQETGTIFGGGKGKRYMPVAREAGPLS